ncbi:MAG: Hsp20/alpha crystallin family protein [Opitutae bacterium]|nr:Hsp20/alpha crystallin family protein [Opitutae bacterium]
MTLFNQIVPRLSRALARREANDSTASSESEFTLKPVYELKETDEAWGLTVQLPGVAKDGLELSAEDGVLSIHGRRAWQKPEGWTQLYRETVDAPYALSFEHDNSVDVDKIHAELKDGVLRVSLPKAEAVKPRKIAVN